TGAVVIVSHDPFILEMTADSLWLVDAGTVKPYDGSLDDYRQFLLSKGRDARRAEKGEAAPVKKIDRKEQRRQAAAKRALLAPLKKKIAASEKKVADYDGDKAKLKEALGDASLYEGDNGKLLDLQKQMGQLEKAQADEEVRWVAMLEELEQAGKEN
ncbi:MAG: ABC transporter ATP-binding protein, partial [Sphingomonadales bacterium]|nr:ABC transporter ATP-binding protein [Sphingomonadales bacterium]